MKNNIIFLRDSANILMNLKDGTTIVKLSFNIQMTYSHTFKIIDLLVKKKIVKKVSLDGRAKALYLTEIGKKIKESLLIIREYYNAGRN